MISGMVMPLSLDRMQFKWSRIGAFMAKRVVRLQPPLILSAAVMTAVTYGILQAKGLNIWAVFLGSATLTSPFFSIPWANDIYWTLFVEMQYYLYIALLFPLLISQRVQVRWVVVALALALSLLTQLESWYWMKLTLPFHIPVFMMGYFLFMIYSRKIKLLEFLVGIVLSGITCAYVTGHLLGLGYRIVCVALVTVLMIQLLRKGWRWLSTLGEYSYSLYLIHWSIIGLFYNYVGP
ncbi:MAG: acyltransferase family protein, partial [Flavobacteriales bacterium]